MFRALAVIPAEAGTRGKRHPANRWVPAFAGMTVEGVRTAFARKKLPGERFWNFERCLSG